MSEKQSKEYPYKSLGNWLKSLRQKKEASIAEVSGAVEIDPSQLSDIEKGITRPSEDILMLLISYFSVKEDDAVKVWEMAGYNKNDDSNYANEQKIQQVLVMPMDARIAYTDMAHVVSNKYGLIINFMQADGIGGQPLAVARVGMSFEHAHKLLKVLEKTLKKPQQKLLPAPETGDEAAN